jgi:uncharacterized protein (TIGR04141 family)
VDYSGIPLSGKIKMPINPKQWPLSIYLLKKEVTEVKNALRLNANVHQITIGKGNDLIGTLFYRTIPPRPPRWVAFFDSYLEPNEVMSSGVAGVLIVPAAGRLFALTFGSGRHLLSPGTFEEGFGLRATLNSVSPDRIRSIDRKALDATGRHSREQASRNIPIIEFGLDIDKDILHAVMGPPEDISLGRRFAGADALSVVVGTKVENLPTLLETYMNQYRKRTYRDRFPWVDNIKEVSDRGLRTVLDRDLEKLIKERKLERIWMAVPELVDWHDVKGFSFTYSEEQNLLDDIGFDSFLVHVHHPDEINIATLHRHRVYCISAETDAPKSEWSVYKCIYAEIDRNKSTFLLNDGRWYEVARGYVREIDDAIQRIPQLKGLTLPKFTDQNEKDYNNRVSKGNPLMYALMDRKMIPYGGGNSKIEFCDLYTRNRQIIHVKRYGGSGTLSHLFAQGYVSASIFLNDDKFRKAVNDEFPDSHKLHPGSGRLKSSDYEVAFVIASKVVGQLVLPFFSRVTLRSAVSQLRNMGYGVTLTKVECN